LKKLPISVLIQTKNEELSIAKCLSGLADFGEVIVVDSNSTDKTKEIAESLGVTVASFAWDGNYPKKKQWQLLNLETAFEWVLFLDADEAPSPQLIESIRTAVPALRSGNFGAFDLKLDYVFAGKLLRHGHRVVKRALVHRNKVQFPAFDDLDAIGMGELEGHYQPSVDGKVGHLKGALLHDDQDPVRTWFSRHNGYSDWEAHLRTHGVVRSAVAKQRSLQGKLFDAVPFKPAAFFTYAYVARLGFLDGRAGFDYALALAFYYWQIGLKVREIARESVRDHAAQTLRVD
jgi:glycosyltransferase involved in cell wall biosynthesis